LQAHFSEKCLAIKTSGPKYLSEHEQFDLGSVGAILMRSMRRKNIVLGSQAYPVDKKHTDDFGHNHWGQLWT
jgi:hypothetical protein